MKEKKSLPNSVVIDLICLVNQINPEWSSSSAAGIPPEHHECTLFQPPQPEVEVV